MHRALELLVLGRREVAKDFRDARKRWLIIFAEEKNSNVEKLANRLSREQGWFEAEFGGRQGHHYGQVIMVWSAFATFYSTGKGFTPNRKKFMKNLLDAFNKSYCSIEVKYEVLDAASSYSLE